MRTLQTVSRADDFFSCCRTKGECLESGSYKAARHNSLRVAVKTSQRNSGCDNGRPQPVSADHNCAEPLLSSFVQKVCTCAHDVLPSIVSKIVEQSSTRNKKGIHAGSDQSNEMSLKWSMKRYLEVLPNRQIKQGVWRSIGHST